MDWLTLALFCAALLLCVAFDISILCALVIGLALFLAYGRRKGFTWPELAQMTLEGVKTVKNILITFLLIGILTALWRTAGTVPLIVCYASSLIRPSVFLLMTFLLNCGVSLLTGTSFGTGATMGVICAAIGTALNIDPRWVGGAILSGVFFGDRCSPVSTSALLVSELTGTNIYDNFKKMMRTAFLPFLASCAVYAFLGFRASGSGDVPDLYALFSKEFALHWFALAPAAVIFLLAVLRVNVKLTMLASILTSVPLCIFLQHTAPVKLLQISLAGFYASDAAVGTMLNGGGIVSMLRVAGIVCLSASYSGIFQETGLLERVKRAIQTLSRQTTPYSAMLLTSLLAGIVACNQTLTVMLTEQLCRELNPDKAEYAVDLEDSAIVVAPLVPWSIACGVPLAAAGAPGSAILFAVYLYLLPLWRLMQSLLGKHKRRAAGMRPHPLSR